MLQRHAQSKVAAALESGMVTITYGAADRQNKPSKPISDRPASMATIRQSLAALPKNQLSS